MAARLRRTIAIGLAAAVTMLGAGASTTLLLLHRADPALNVPFIAVSLLLGVALALVGCLLVAARPANRLGPLLCVAGGGMVAEFALRDYAYHGLRDNPGSLPWADVAGWAGLALDPLFFPGPLAVVLLLFPNGRALSARWRPAVAGAGAAVAASIVLLAVRPGPLDDESYGYQVPWRGLLPAGASPATSAALSVLGSLLTVLLAAAVVGLLVRYRRSDRVGRQQLKPLAIAATAAAAFLLVQLVPGLRVVGVVGLVTAVAAGFPLALTVGVLRYRLWDLDRLLVGAIVYGALTALITGVYVGVVVALAALAGAHADSPPLPPLILATVLVAVAFGPVKERLARAARRLVYGVRATPYEALVALPRQLADALAVDEVLPRTAAALTLGLGVPSARARAFVEADQSAVTGTAWFPQPPPEGPEPELVVVPVRHLGVVVGDVAVQRPPDRPLGANDLRLLADLATQAGPSLRGVALAAELRARLEQITAQSVELQASGRRIAAAQADERRRLERDIHDGAQQQLVATGVAIELARDRLAGAVASGTVGPAGLAEIAAEALARCRADVDRCVEDLRELARGIYPPVLAARGLAAALRARARRAPGDVRVVSSAGLDGVRFTPQVEIAAYFACLEALQNAAKHAGSASVLVQLSLDEGAVRFTVTDDGPGFDPASVGGGSGLVGMADRVSAVGGSLVVESAPGRGTTVRGQLPVAAPVAAPVR